MCANEVVTQVVSAYRHPFEIWLMDSGVLWLIPLILTIISLISYFSSKNDNY